MLPSNKPIKAERLAGAGVRLWNSSIVGKTVGQVAGEVEAWAVDQDVRVAYGQPTQIQDEFGTYRWIVKIPIVTGSPIEQCRFKALIQISGTQIFSSGSFNRVPHTYNWHFRATHHSRAVCTSMSVQ